MPEILKFIWRLYSPRRTHKKSRAPWLRHNTFCTRRSDEKKGNFHHFLEHSLCKNWNFLLSISSVNMTIWSHLLKKFLMENFIFCAVIPSAFKTSQLSISCMEFKQTCLQLWLLITSFIVGRWKKMEFWWQCAITTGLLPRDLSSWYLSTVTVTAVNAGALAKRLIFHEQNFVVVMANVKILLSTFNDDGQL